MLGSDRLIGRRHRRDQCSALPEHGEGKRLIFSTDQVDHRVYRGKMTLEPTAGTVEHCVGAKAADIAEVPRAGGGIHLQTRPVRELDCEGADITSGAKHQHALPGDKPRLFEQRLAGRHRHNGY